MGDGHLSQLGLGEVAAFLFELLRAPSTHLRV
jgi:hypothetical protein